MDAPHPGSLLKQVLEERGLSANKLALALRVPSGRITQILNAKRAITPDTALRLGRYFGGVPGEWLRLQTEHDLAVAERDLGARIDSEVAVAAAGGAPDAEPVGERNEMAPAGAAAASVPAEPERRPVSRTGVPLTVRRLRGRSRR